MDLVVHHDGWGDGAISHAVHPFKRKAPIGGGRIETDSQLIAQCRQHARAVIGEARFPHADADEVSAVGPGTKIGVKREHT